MIERVVKIAVTGFAVLVLVYLSQFWDRRLWSSDGLFGIAWLRPQGDLVSSWLGGTSFAPFALVVWGVLVFLVLTWVERLFGFLFRSK